MSLKPKWPIFAVVFAVLGAAGSLLYYHVRGPAPHYTVFVLTVVFAAWAGACAGASVDWVTTRRSPMEPFFPGRFPRYYRLGLWLRFAAAFSAGWLLSVFVSVLYIAFWGDNEELGAFFTPGGLLAIGVMAAIYALIGAMIGGIVSLAVVIFGKGDGDS